MDSSNKWYFAAYTDITWVCNIYKTYGILIQCTQEMKHYLEVSGDIKWMVPPF